MEISGWTIYWILQLDIIVGTLVFVSAVASMAALVLIMVGFAARITSTSDSETALGEGCHRIAGKIAIFLIFAFSAQAILPTSRNMAAILIVPAIANNEAIHAEASELYDMAKQALGRVIAPEQKAEATEAEK